MIKQIKIKLQRPTQFGNYRIKRIANCIVLTREHTGLSTEFRVGNTVSEREATILNNVKHLDVEVVE